MATKKIPFDEFLQKKLTCWDYMNLELYLAESAHRVTKIKNDPTTGSLNHLITLIPLLNKVDKSIDAEFLFLTYDFGSLNISQAERNLVINKTINA